MQKTISYLFLVMIITGTLFTACGPAVETPAEETESTEKIEESKEEEKVEDNKEEVKVEETKTEPVKETQKEPVKEAPKEEAKETPKEEPVVTTKYVDGVYTQTGSYQSPAGPETITVTVTVGGDVVKSLTVTPNTSNETSKIYQGLFRDGVNSLVVGKNIDEISGFSQVNGSSLTPGGFNGAFAQVKASAKR